jgi:hypothetical protein
MEVGDWITLGAVIVALAIGVTSLLQTQRLQKRERKERLLNEIIEWAIDVAKCGLEKDLPDTSRITDVNDGKLHLAYSTNILAKSYQSMRGRNQYISQIVLTFGIDLQEAVSTLNKDVEEHIKLLDVLYNNVTVRFVSLTNSNIAEYTEQITKYTTQISMHRWKLDESTNKVIEEATKISTRDIG